VAKREKRKGEKKRSFSVSILINLVRGPAAKGSGKKGKKLASEPCWLLPAPSFRRGPTLKLKMALVKGKGGGKKIVSNL